MIRRCRGRIPLRGCIEGNRGSRCYMRGCITSPTCCCLQQAHCKCTPCSSVLQFSIHLIQSRLLLHCKTRSPTPMAHCPLEMSVFCVPSSLSRLWSAVRLSVRYPCFRLLPADSGIFEPGWTTPSLPDLRRQGYNSITAVGSSAVSCSSVLRSDLMISRYIAFAKIGGTAFPICLRTSLVPNRCSMGNVCRHANSRLVNPRLPDGW